MNIVSEINLTFVYRSAGFIRCVFGLGYAVVKLIKHTTVAKNYEAINYSVNESTLVLVHQSISSFGCIFKSPKATSPSNMHSI